MKQLLILVGLFTSFVSIAQQTIKITVSKSQDGKIALTTTLDGKPYDKEKDQIFFTKGTKITIKSSTNLKGYKVQLFNNTAAPEPILKSEYKFSANEKSADFEIVDDQKIKYGTPSTTSDNQIATDVKVSITNVEHADDTKAIVLNTQAQGTSETGSSDCKKLKKSNLRFTFFSIDSIFKSNYCNNKSCDTCPDAYNTIVYNFANDSTYLKLKGSTGDSVSFKKPFIVKVGDPLQFRIKNANPIINDITISDTSKNFNQETNDILDKLSGGDYLKKLASSVTAQSSKRASNKDSCKLTIADSISAAVLKLAVQLENLNVKLQNLSPYIDPSCYRNLLSRIRDSIDVNIHIYFWKDNIYTFEDLVTFLKVNADSDAKTDVASTLNTAYQKLFTQNFGYLYKIIEVQNVDEVDFRSNILPKNKDAALPVVKNGIIKVYTKGGFKVDVSSGLYYAWMNNVQYSIRADSTVIKNSIGGDSTAARFSNLYKENIGKGEFGFSSFLHFYPRTGLGINFAPVIGAGVSFQDKPQIKYFAGGSILLGRDDRIAINGGAVFGNVNQLSAQYIKDANGNFKNLSFEEAGKDPVYIKQFQIKAFLSVTYNLSFLKKKQETQIVQVPNNTSNQSSSSNNNTDSSGAAKNSDSTQSDNKSTGTDKAKVQSSEGSTADSILKNASKIKIKK